LRGYRIPKYSVAFCASVFLWRKIQKIQAYCCYRSASAALCERPQRSLRLISPQRARRKLILPVSFTPLWKAAPVSINKETSSIFLLHALKTHYSQLNSLTLSPAALVSLSLSPFRVFRCSCVRVFGCSGVRVFLSYSQENFSLPLSRSLTTHYSLLIQLSLTPLYFKQSP